MVKLYLKKRNTTDKDKTYFLVTDDWSNGYFHWICDVLPKVAINQEILKEVCLILPDSINDDFYYETLETFNFAGIINIQQQTYLSVNKLIFQENLAKSGNFNTEAINHLRNHFIKFYKQNSKDDNDAPERIYISREKAVAKHILNEHDITQITDKYSFKTIYFEEYNLIQKIGLMRNCKILVGMHGANLTNALFMEPEGAIMELRKKDDFKNNAYFSLSSSLNIAYFYQLCDYDNKNYTHPNRFDLWVDTKKFETNIKLMIKKTQN